MDSTSLPVLVGLFFRHALTSVGGYLVSHGLITAASVEPFVGAAMVLGGLLFSYVNKRRTGQFS